MAHRRASSALFVSLLTCLAAAAQQDASTFKIGNVAFSGSIRERLEDWDWFNAPGQNSYPFSETLLRFGAFRNGENIDWKLEFGVPVLIGLPDHAVDGAPQGQLGYGGSYYAANQNRTNAAMISPKQVYVRFHGGGKIRESLRLGRFQFSDGMELAPDDPTVADLQRIRISERLIGPFGFTVAERSLDGVTYSSGTARTNLTLVASRPTRGAFQVDGWGEVNVNLFYGALTHLFGSRGNEGDFRVFAIGYQDMRDSTLKTDNRAAATRAADKQDIAIGTYGASYTHALSSASGTCDLLLWGAGQSGSWGTQTDRAYAYAAEVGWQPPLNHWRPWLRGGYDYGSGDSNPKDNVHGSFFQILPTARTYARFPFFNMMNNRDAFGELVLRPRKNLTLRADGHALALASKNDLWYSGGGAFQPWTFGYTGRPSNGATSLANLFDLSADYAFTRNTSFGAYYGHAFAKTVIRAIYPKGVDGNMGLLEIVYRF